MSKTHTDSIMPLRQSVEIPSDYAGQDDLKPGEHAMSHKMPSEPGRDMGEFVEEIVEGGEPPLHNNCGEDQDVVDQTITLSSNSKMAGQSVTPFLAKHIPQSYAPLGNRPPATTASQKDPNTKYCYRHRPDSKCRRTADEPTMENLQRVGLQEWHVGCTS
jgi:F-box/WD-40 domain protein MET30